MNKNISEQAPELQLQVVYEKYDRIEKMWNDAFEQHYKRNGACMQVTLLSVLGEESNPEEALALLSFKKGEFCLHKIIMNECEKEMKKLQDRATEILSIYNRQIENEQQSTSK